VPVTHTLAYYNKVSVMEKKSFITLTSGRARKRKIYQQKIIIESVCVCVWCVCVFVGVSVFCVNMFVFVCVCVCVCECEGLSVLVFECVSV
jgi:hypothetical protein